MFNDFDGQVKLQQSQKFMRKIMQLLAIIYMFSYHAINICNWACFP